MPIKPVYRRLAAGTLVFVFAVIAASLFIIGPDALFITGAFAGGLLMCYKAAFWWKLPAVIAAADDPSSEENGNKKRPLRAVLVNVFLQVLTGIALLTAALVNTVLFYGMAAGMLAAVAGTVTSALLSKAWRES